MPQFSVHVEAQGDEPGNVTDAALSEFLHLLAPYSGSASGGSGRPAWGATISIEAADVPEAVAVATYLISETATRAGLPRWPVVRAAAVREDVLEGGDSRSHQADLVAGPGTGHEHRERDAQKADGPDYPAATERRTD